MQRVTNRWKKSCRAPEAAWNTCASDAWHVVFVGAARRSWVEALSLRRCKAWLAAGRCLRTLAGVVRAFGLVLVREDDRTPATDWPRLGGGHLQQIPSPPARAHLRELFSIPPRSDTFMRMTSQLTYAANVNHLHSFFFFCYDHPRYLGLQSLSSDKKQFKHFDVVLFPVVHSKLVLLLQPREVQMYFRTKFYNVYEPVLPIKWIFVLVNGMNKVGTKMKRFNFAHLFAFVQCEASGGEKHFFHSQERSSVEWRKRGSENL